jgi:hypothetical protein
MRWYRSDVWTAYHHHGLDGINDELSEGDAVECCDGLGGGVNIGWE